MTPHASIPPAPTLAEVREHARLALARKPCPLDLELLAQDVLWLVGRVEELGTFVSHIIHRDSSGISETGFWGPHGGWSKCEICTAALVAAALERPKLFAVTAERTEGAR